MSLPQFSCPHCLNLFQVETSLPSLQVACPYCQQPVTVSGVSPASEPPASEPLANEPLANEPPVSEPPVAEPPFAAPPVLDLPCVKPEIAEVPAFDPSGDSPADPGPSTSAISPNAVMPQEAAEPEPTTDDYRSRQLVSEERAARKFVKNMIVWVCCAIVLVTILAFFLTQGGS